MEYTVIDSSVADNTLHVMLAHTRFLSKVAE
jgi:hypothetical protein